MTICATPINETVVNGTSNIITLVLEADGDTLEDLSAVTRTTIDLDGGTTVIDSVIVGSTVIWWTDLITWRGVSTNVLRLRIGGQSITPGVYSLVAIKIYAPTYTDGLQVENSVLITVT